MVSAQPRCGETRTLSSSGLTVTVRVDCPSPTPTPTPVPTPSPSPSPISTPSPLVSIEQVYFGPVKFIKTPVVVRPEQWGAKCNSPGFDSLQAFRAMTASISSNPPYTHPSTKIELQTGCTYYLSDALEILSSVAMGCDAGFGWGPCAWLNFTKPNGSGIIIHALSTKTGNDKGGDDGRFTRLYGFGVRGNTGPPTHTVSIEGLKVTKQSGPDFADDQGYHGPNVFSINGFEYVMDTVISPTEMSLKPPTVLLKAVQGSREFKHAMQGAGTFPFTSDWKGYAVTFKRIENNRLVEKSYKILSTTPTGGDPGIASGTMEVSEPFEWPDGLYTATISGASIKNAPARANLFHGIDSRGTVQIENMYVLGFAGNGISFDSSLSPSAFPGTVPNTNLSRVSSTFVYGNMGNGFAARGVNSNQAFIGPVNDFTNNRGAGIAEFSFLGNNYLSNHTSFNGRADRVGITGSVNVSNFLSEYGEGGQPCASFGQNMVVIGGNYGAGVCPDSEAKIYIGGTAATGIRDTFLFANGDTATGNIGGPVTKLVYPKDNLYILTVKDRYVSIDTSQGGPFVLNFLNANAYTGMEFTISVSGKDRAAFFSPSQLGIAEAKAGETVTLYSDGDRWVVKAKH